MSMNLNRWLKYAKAKLDDTLSSANEELDELEARRNAELADKPWLASEGDAPTFDEARARIAWEAERTRRAGDVPEDRAGGHSEAAGEHEPGAPTDPPTGEEAAERSAARIVLDQRAEESAARLAAIRRELGVDDPEDPPV